MSWFIKLLIINQYLLLNQIHSFTTNFQHCECGIKNPDVTHFVNKKEFSGNHAWPWMISIVNITDSPVAYCGGSLINDRWIMTAAHCIPDMNETGIDNFRVYVGTNYIILNEQPDDYLLNLGIMDIVIHPKFDFDTADYDIALIKLSEIVTFTRFIRPICLKQNGAPYIDKIGIITGWGSFNLTEPTENQLKETQVQVVSNEICQKNYSTVDIPVTERMICAALPNQDPCKGDSGGPLVVRDVNNRNKYNQIGIISHGEGCSVPNFPAIFSRVQTFTGWILENTKDAFYCRGTFD